MNVRDAIRLIVMKCPGVAAEAARALMAPERTVALRYRALLPRALRDPESTLTEEDREVLLDALDPAPHGEERSVQLNIRLAPSELELVRMMAEAEGMTVSAWVRRRIIPQVGEAQGE